jgi:glycosyltransferase involved in cell wall biosynthesis
MPDGRVTAGSRVFVIGAYVGNGGMFMAYHLGRILHRDFGLRVFAVTVREETPDASPFDYDPVFDSVSVEQMSAMATAGDVVIANPSYSRLNLGLTSPALKVMYVQHFNTFRTLDLGFDCYISVSEVVRAFLSTVWGLETSVIAPFVNVSAVRPPPWAERPAGSITVACKGDMRQQLLVLDRLRRAIVPRLPHVRLDGILASARQQEFHARIGAARHLLSLSIAEGFGLAPLEAMALGTTVVGFDALGGRDYMRPGVNCEAVAYPDIDGLAARLIRVLEDPAHAEALARAGQPTAAAYSYDRFRLAWREVFAGLFGWS